MLGLAASDAGGKLVVAIVGDGSFLFGVPSSSFWIARRYETVRESKCYCLHGVSRLLSSAFPHYHPQQRRLAGVLYFHRIMGQILDSTPLLQSPNLSMLGVHPSGIGAPMPGHELTVGFGPHVPDYAEVVVAATAGWAFGNKVSAANGRIGLEEGVREAIHAVLIERRCAAFNIELKSIC